MASCYREAKSFAVQAKHVRRAQVKVLLRTIRRNQDCWFGREYGFRHISSLEDFRKQVPLATYDEFEPAIDRICAGEKNVLTTEPVLLLEPTSGTSSREKLIPFTNSLRWEFQAGVRTWIYDLFRNRPAARRGKAYWSISPLAQTRRMTAGGLPIGFAEDTAYLGRWEQAIVRRTLAVPPEIALFSDVRASRLATLFFLLQSEDLSLISVWSPTFLIQLLSHLKEEFGTLCESIERGQTSFSESAGQPFDRRLFQPNPSRAAFLRNVFCASDDPSEWTSKIWSKLALVSCWADGASATYAAGLQQMLPQVDVQPKGLLATEAFVSLPLVGQIAPALAYRSHFFEFLPAGMGDANQHDTLLADELQVGSQYEVVISTGGGLYRYRMFDQVEVVGQYCQVPLLQFLGRANATSDLVGEKITEAQASSAIHRALSECELYPSFILLLPMDDPPARYAVFLEFTNQEPSKDKLATLANRIDELLRTSASYRYARELGQLGMINILLAPSTAEGFWPAYEASCIRNGQRLGNIKATVIANLKRS
jgi:hypothetical protein